MSTSPGGAVRLRQLPECFGTEQEKGKPCPTCPVSDDCRDQFFKFCAYPTVYEAAEDLTSETRKTLTLKSALSLLQQLTEEYGTPRRPYAVIPPYQKALVEALRFCKDSRIDPSMFLRAQFASLSDFLRRLNLAIQPGMLRGKGALKRYQSWSLFHAKTTLSGTGGKPDMSLLPAACYHAMNSVAEHLSGGMNEARILTFVRTCWPSYDPDTLPRYVRLQALARVLDAVEWGLSRRILLINDRFEWRDVAAFLKRWIGDKSENDARSRNGADPSRRPNRTE